MKTLRLFLAFSLLFLPLCLLHVHSQTVAFGYNGAGQRISRRVVTLNLMSVDSVAVADSLLLEEGVESVLEKCTLTAFPNPTRGEVTVVVSGGDGEQVGRMVVCDQWGKPLEHREILGNGEVRFDLSGRPSGFYFLIFTRGEDRLDYKIIKTE